MSPTIDDGSTRNPRKTKLDDFKPVIREFVERDPKASAVVIAEHLGPLGFTGEVTILRRYLKTLREIARVPRAFIRIESSPGDRFGLPAMRCKAVWSQPKRLLYTTPTREAKREIPGEAFTHPHAATTETI
jgi:transposase